MNFYDKLYLLAVDTKIEDALKEAGPPKGVPEDPVHGALRRAHTVRPSASQEAARRRPRARTTAAGGGAPGLPPGQGRGGGGRPATTSQPPEPRTSGEHQDELEAAHRRANEPNPRGRRSRRR